MKNGSQVPKKKNGAKSHTHGRGGVLAKRHVTKKNSQKESHSHVPREGIVMIESQVLKKKEQKGKEDVRNDG